MNKFRDKPAHLKIDVIIPMYNEEQSIAKVIGAIPGEWVREIVVVNNASEDDSRETALKAGATVIDQPKRGYGNACLKGMEFISQKEVQPDIVVFMDADFADFPEQLPEVVKPIVENDRDLVIGSRALGKREEGAMPFQARFGNWLACFLIRMFYGYLFTDLGPFRAIKWGKLIELKMIDRNYGWTVEMQIKAAQRKLKTAEVPVDYKARIGKSKVSGTVKGSVMAGYKILLLIFKYAVRK